MWLLATKSRSAPTERQIPRSHSRAEKNRAFRLWPLPIAAISTDMALGSGLHTRRAVTVGNYRAAMRAKAAEGAALFRPTLAERDYFANSITKSIGVAIEYPELFRVINVDL
jgi:hypothetical protein